MMLDHALGYAARGWPVLPVEPRGVEPLAPLENATTNAVLISRWWKRWPDANIGIAVGEAAGFWALDIHGAEGSASLTALEEEFGALPETLGVQTGAGRQLHFSWPGERGIRSQSGLRPGIDVLGAGSYVVVPPSIHPSGRPYEWL